MRKRILVIDDDRAVRRAFQLALEDTGYQVDTAETGELGIERVQHEDFDLIFLDLKMPGMGGAETLRVLRKRLKETPIYIVTAFLDEFLHQLNQAGAEGIAFELLNKPVESHQIVTLARAVLDGAEVY